MLNIIRNEVIGSAKMKIINNFYAFDKILPRSFSLKILHFFIVVIPYVQELNSSLYITIVIFGRLRVAHSHSFNMRNNTTKINFLTKISIFCLIVPHVEAMRDLERTEKDLTGWEAKGNS